MILPTEGAKKLNGKAVSTLTQSHVVFNPYDYGLVDAAKIKYFLETHFAQTLKFTFLY